MVVLLAEAPLFAVRRVRAMNTDIELRAPDLAAAPLLAAAGDVFAAIERRFSRFRDDSELTALNVRARPRVRVSADMLALVELALRLHRVTGGVFDPSILPQLEAEGYDRSFERVDATNGPAMRPSRTARFATIEIDSTRRHVTLPDGMRIDLGGIGKGWAVDRAAELLAPTRHALINAGGDVIAMGSDGHHAGWTVAIEHPFTGEIISTVELRNQGLATSTTALRRWTRNGEQRHHLIDPADGRCARSGVASVSIIAPRAVEADVFAKSALIMGEDAGRTFLAAVNCPGLFVLDDGTVHVTDDWQDQFYGGDR